MEKTVTLQETNDNTPMGEVFVGLFDAIALIASNNDVVTVDNHNISNQLLNACLEFYCINRGHNILTSDIENYIFDVSGISILGSYVQNQLYLDSIGDNDAKAITLAKKGFSTKNRPDAENRGFGISSNIDMITNGLHGSMYILSGTGLMMCQKSKMEVLSMPSPTEWEGTLIFTEIPLDTPKDFDFYKYM